MYTFYREYLPPIWPTGEAIDFADNVMHWADLFDNDPLLVYVKFHDIYDTDRARMTGMMT